MLYYILFVSTASSIYKLPVCSSTTKLDTLQPTQGSNESTLESKCEKICEYC